MAEYLDRYMAGEHEAVWADLVAAGDKVREEPLLSDARAVAQQTMRRAKHNIIILQMRLREIGYQFVDSSRAFIPTTPGQIKALDALEDKIGPIPLSLRAWIEEVGEVDLRGTYPRLCYYNSKLSMGGKMAIGRQDGPGTEVVDMADLDMGQMLDDVNAAEAIPQEVKDTFMNFGKFFNSIFAEQDAEQVEGTPSAMPEDQRVASDPLVVDLHEFSLESYAYEEWEAYEGRETFDAYIAPDRPQKSNPMAMDSEGGYEIHLPHAGADVPLLYTDFGEISFVEYLRKSFEWAGFPGLRDFANRDADVLAQLKEGLYPL